MKFNFLNVFLYISLIGIGIIAGIAIRHYSTLPLSESINIIDLATLVTTIFLAVYIPEVLDRKLQINKDKKKLIEDRLGDLQILCRKVNILVQSDPTVTTRNILIVNNSLDIITYKIETIRTLLANAKFKQNYNKELESINLLCEQHKKILWVNETVLENYSYSIEVQKQEEILYNKIDEATSLLIFKISEM